VKRAWHFIALLALVTTRAQAQEGGSPLTRSVRALDANDLAAARAAFSELSPEQLNGAEARLQTGMLAFYEGNYADAGDHLEAAVAGLAKSPRLSEYRKLLEWATAARDLTQGFERVRSADGRFEIRYAPGPDRILADYALETLGAADSALRTHLGIALPSPIRLEIYPSAKAFAQVSSLSLENIETTGTVALCKWNRLMIATPRSLLYGYPWLDTIHHEFVHLALTYASRNRAPVWFHEGLAKLFERTWRGEAPSAGLSPQAEQALVQAAKSQHLIAFDAMHPSIAMLPSQEDAALAFAEVSTLLEYVRDKHGDDALRHAIADIARGVDARAALGNAAGKTFQEVERAWKESLSSRKAPRTGKSRELKVRLVERGASDASLDVAEERARKHLRLGDLLWGQHRTIAASFEYKQGQRHAPDDAILASRVAQAALGLGRPNEAAQALVEPLKVHAHHAPLLSLRGKAALALQQLDDARAFWGEALRQNPFEPGPHCGLAKIALSPQARAREGAACSLLGDELP
jgi:tetratricopeptide (TPR) repeat protein